jgi:hypothetical protein
VPEPTTHAASPEDPSGSTIRVYGVPGPTVPADADVGTDAGVPIVYCGLRAGSNDIRIPTGRVFHLPRGDIGETGATPDYSVGGQPVNYYDVRIDADVRESVSKPVSLGAEIVNATGGTFASLAATPPDRTVGYPDEFETKSREELMSLARQFLGPRDGGQDDLTTLPAYCAGYCQTNRSTWMGFWYTSDEWGGDCD